MVTAVVRVRGWEGFEWLRAGFSTRVGGVSEVYGAGELNLGMTAEDEAWRVRENRRLFLEAVAGEREWRLATVRQVHSAEVQVVGPGWESGDADGMVTRETGVMLGVGAADCVPVLVADMRLRVVGAFHAGWRGTVGRIVEAGVERMVREFGSKGENLVGAVGPAIGACCYEVGDEVRGKFAREFGYGEELFAGKRLDLAEANRRQMLEVGVGSVTVVGECTACSRWGDGRRKYFSHRGEQGRAGRGMGVIGVRP